MTPLRAALCLLVCLALPAATSTADRPVAPSPILVDSASIGAALNAQRAGNGLGALATDAALERAAAGHAADMVARGYFSHTSQNGASMADRARGAGYCYRQLGENIAQGQTTEAQAIATWMNSPPHRDNILMRDATAYGFGRAGNTWVLMVGRGC